MKILLLILLFVTGAFSYSIDSLLTNLNLTGINHPYYVPDHWVGPINAVFIQGEEGDHVLDPYGQIIGYINKTEVSLSILKYKINYCVLSKDKQDKIVILLLTDMAVIILKEVPPSDDVYKLGVQKFIQVIPFNAIDIKIFAK